ncbi:Ribosomal RNA-processing protein 7 [Ophiocordyceps camponoti-floridani]|uniref:Ribosomal RNA-processing protein 7 n=1 Tax=Ophiocordyceps camponoti-floridani TaxID=2030778 RepID=A0A8H4QCS5_9HYPO|nr:Ribosomal RNA-processing protein 7 [Ophiocordyceps camponoti-floridani]
MIDAQSLHTASLYINNQLVSRGLLQDGQGIDFAHAGDDSPEAACERAGRIIGIVNDLILRRDRDAQHVESLSTSLRSLRADNARLTSDVARLSEKKAEERRRADMATTAESTARSQLRTAEAKMRSLKEDMTRMKTLVTQTRAACATEVRRRDRTNDGLKKQLVEAGRWRGARTNPSVTTIHVTESSGRDEDELAAKSTSEEDYDLRCETNSFLARLAQELSRENEAVLDLMSRTASQLRDMSGFHDTNTQPNDNDALPISRRPGWHDLESELEAVMTHMRNMLTNPSFVPIEEVVAREDEIDRLKAGWLKMESRWGEAVLLLDGWRRRMAASGRLVCEDDDELRRGIKRLSPERVRDGPRSVRGLETLAEEEEKEEKEEGR